MPPRFNSNAAASPEEIGPFTILALGNRLGSLDVMRAAKVQPNFQNTEPPDLHHSAKRIAAAHRLALAVSAVTCIRRLRLRHAE